MNTKFAKATLFIFLAIPLPAHATRGISKSLFARRISSLPIYRNVQDFQNLPFISDTKSLYLQNHHCQTSLKKLQKKDLIRIKEDFKKQSKKFHFEEFVGPLIIGITLGTGLKNSYTKQKVYADDISHDDQIKKEIIDASIAHESLEVLKNRLKDQPLLIKNIKMLS